MLSICIITKNEELNIDKCLKSFSGLDVELVVVDTGSTDKTVEIARKYTDSVYHFEWCNDFSKAKNFAISKAANRFVCVIDADEYAEGLTKVEVDSLVKLAQKNPLSVGRIKRINFTENGNDVEWINRVFDRELFNYTGRIHEQVTSKDNSAYDTYLTNVVIMHTGYMLSEEDRIKKANRNITLLKEELNRVGDDPYYLYQLGKSYYFIKDYVKACEAFEKGLSYDLDPKLEYVIDMVQTNGYALVNSGNAQVALAYESIYDEFGNTADFNFLMGIIYMNNELFDKAIESFIKATKFDNCRLQGVNSYLAYYNAGVICEVLGRTDEATNFYKKCGNYDKALARLACI